MDATEHMHNPHWEPVASPLLVIQQSVENLFVLPTNLLVKHLRVHVPSTDHPPDTAAAHHQISELCERLRDKATFPSLEHFQFHDIQGRAAPHGAAVPSSLLNAVGATRNLMVVTFSFVTLPLHGLTLFLENTQAHTLNFYSVAIHPADSSQLSTTSWRLSPLVNNLSVSDVPLPLKIALINGCLENAQSKMGSYLCLSLNPDDLTPSLWNFIEPNFSACRLLEFKNGNRPFFTAHPLDPCNLFSRLSGANNAFNHLLELRLTKVKWERATFDLFLDFLRTAPHLQSLRIDHWDLPLWSELDQNYHLGDMYDLFNALSETKHNIWFVFTDAPFCVLEALADRCSHMSVSLIHIEARAPPAAWYPLERYARLAKMADWVVSQALENTNIGRIADNRKREWALEHCNGGMSVTVQDTHFIGEELENRIQNACLNNYYVDRDDIDLRLVMHPPDHARPPPPEAEEVRALLHEVGGAHVVASDDHCIGRQLEY